jgi:anti-sigma-K factor RskA
VPLQRRRRFRIASLAAAAAVLAVVGVGAVFQPWQDQREPSVAVQTPAERVLAADDAKKVQLDFEDGSRATVVRSLSEGKAVLLTTDMAAPPSGKVFELWLQDDSGAMKPAGLMGTGGDHTILLDGDASAATGVGITVEPEGGSDQPTSEPIALFDFDKATA